MTTEIKIGIVVQCLPTPNPVHRRFAGTIHTVREKAVVFKEEYGGQSYFLDPPTKAFDRSEGIELMWTKKYLRIIDNPKDDEVDQTLAWKSVPTTDEVAA